MNLRRFVFVAVFLNVWIATAVGVAQSTASAEEHFSAGAAAFGKGDLAVAVRELSAAMRAQPAARTALYLGNVYLKLHKLAAAKSSFEAALSLDPGSAKAPMINALIRSIDERNVVTYALATVPAGASVYVDGAAEAAGITPIELGLKPGRHLIRIEREGYESESNEVRLKFDGDKSVTLTLRAKPCELKVSAKPPKTTVTLDGTAAQAVPAVLSIGVGDHLLVFSAPTFDSLEHTVTCTPGASLNVAPELVPKRGRLKLPIEAGTVVTVDGAVVALDATSATQGIGLSPGRHEITVTSSGRPKWTKVVEVGAGAEVAIAPPATEPPPPPAPKEPPVAAAPAAAYAPGSLYVGVQGGGNFVLRHWDLGQNAFVAQDGKSGVFAGTSAIAGLRIGVQVFERLAVEAEGNWVGLPSTLGTSHGATYGINAVLHVLDGEWTPIVEAGGGVYHVISGELGSNIDPRAHLGVGLRGRVLDWLVLRADARDVVSDGFDFPGANNLETLVGVEIYLYRAH